MPESENIFIKLKTNPWPEFSAASYRYFFHDEKHITRIANYYVLIFMLERALFFTEDGHDIELREGEWYIQRPDLLQTGIIGSPAPSYFYIHFTAEGEVINKLNNLVFESKENKMPIVVPVRGNFDVRIFKPLFDQLDYSYKNRNYDILSQQYGFLSILKNITVSSIIDKEEQTVIAQQIIDYISANYNKDIYSERLEEEFHFSSDYITRKVKQFCGLTPGQYIQHLRIARAKELLTNTDHILSYISSEVGYNDTTVFYKAFKKQTGMSPGAWREKSRGI